MTLKEQLDEANSKLQTAEQERDSFKTKHENEVKAHGETKTKLEAAEKARDEHKTNLDNETKAHGETKGKVTAAEKERDDLKAQDKSAGTKAAEQLAAAGVPPAQKDKPAALSPDAKDGAALAKEYEELMAAGKNREASAFWNANVKALEAYANSAGKK